MIPTRTINGPFRPFLIPAVPDGVSYHSQRCVDSIFLEQEYDYPRDRVEDVRTLLDIGINLGAFTVWAKLRWPGLSHVVGYDPHWQALELAEHNTRDLGFEVVTHCKAVTVDPTPFLMAEDANPDNWGGWHTKGAKAGLPVPSVHPRDLPPTDALKIDCEGCEGEVIEHYQHLGGVKVLLMEIHDLPDEERWAMYKRIENAGLVLRRGNPKDPSWDCRVWVRP